MSLFQQLFGGGQPSADLKNSIDKGAFLVDVRTPGEFSGGSVPGAVNIPLDMIPAQLATFKGKESIVLFCRSGMRSGQAKGILESNGFKNVINGGTWEDVSRLVK
jgi:phage shock protein E